MPFTYFIWRSFCAPGSLFSGCRAISLLLFFAGGSHILLLLSPLRVGGPTRLAAPPVLVDHCFVFFLIVLNRAPCPPDALARHVIHAYRPPAAVLSCCDSQPGLPNRGFCLSPRPPPLLFSGHFCETGMPPGYPAFYRGFLAL